ILPSAAIVTALNRFLILREKDNDAEFTEEVRKAYSKQVESESPADKKISIPEQKPSTADKLKSADKSKTADKLKTSTKDNSESSTKDKAEKSFELPKLEIAKPEKVLDPAQIDKPSAEVDKPLNEVDKPLAEKKVTRAIQAEHFEQVLKAAQAEKNFDAESVKAEKNSPAESSKVEEPLADVDKNLADVDKNLADTETLESLLEYAKAEKAKGNITATIDAYEKALEDYGADDYAPFIAIDLSAIYREQAAYTKAIKVYEEALTLPAVKKNSAVEAEFKRKLAYMQTVQAVLLRHKALTTPFSQIPISYMQEVELEFRENILSEDL
ncbi:MAG: hypothetical protein IJU91_00075, partial [Selenomonadaceae bacterium]|nr:hypothetical protein [Selenomonadaceae bacterium]